MTGHLIRSACERHKKNNDCFIMFILLFFCGKIRLFSLTRVFFPPNHGRVVSEYTQHTATQTQINFGTNIFEVIRNFNPFKLQFEHNKYFLYFSIITGFFLAGIFLA